MDNGIDGGLRKNYRLDTTAERILSMGLEYGFKRWYPDAGRCIEQYEKDSGNREKFVKEITQR